MQYGSTEADIADIHYSICTCEYVNICIDTYRIIGITSTKMLQTDMTVDKCTPSYVKCRLCHHLP